MNTLLSVVVPWYNEAEVLWETHTRLRAVMSRLGDLEFELIYVDDGSRDATQLASTRSSRSTRLQHMPAPRAVIIGGGFGGLSAAFDGRRACLPPITSSTVHAPTRPGSD